MKTIFLYILILWLGLATNSNALEFTTHEKALIQSLSGKNLSIPLDKSNRVSGHPLAIKMGKELFFSKQLTPKQNFSCASCHQPQKGWSDNKHHSKIQNKAASKHTPSLWNVGSNRWFFWDGRADSLWSQATQSLEAHNELNSNRIFIARRVMINKNIKSVYQKLFKPIPQCINLNNLPLEGKPTRRNQQMNQNWKQLSACQKQGVNDLFSAVTKMIAAFEETIISKKSPFDQFANDLQTQHTSTQLTEHQQQGLKLFIGKAKCIACHSGANFTDNEFHSIFFDEGSINNKSSRYEGIDKLLHDPFNSKGIYSDHDKKSFNKLDYVYKNIELKGKYKTPSLRNIAESAPYMHDGGIKNLTNVMRYYNHIHTLQDDNQHRETIFNSLTLSHLEQKALIAFLSTLTDKRFLSTL